MFLISLFSSVAVSHGGIHFTLLWGLILLFFLLWFLILIGALHLLGVSVGDTDEVGEGNAKSEVKMKVTMVARSGKERKGTRVGEER